MSWLLPVVGYGLPSVFLHPDGTLDSSLSFCAASWLRIWLLSDYLAPWWLDGHHALTRSDGS